MKATAPPLTRRWVWGQSWPIALANAMGPLVGIADTAVVGRYVGTGALAGIGLGAVIYGIVYWGFGFLRMSTAGLAAQSDGSGDERAVQAHLLRALPLGLGIGLSVLALQTLLIPLIMGAYTAGAGIEAEAAIYLHARLWGLPATLAVIALMGWFVGLGQARSAFAMQAVLNVVNIGLSVLLVLRFGFGLEGVGYASAVAEWVGLGAGLVLAWRLVRARGGWRAHDRADLLDAAQLQRLASANTNIFIRTAAMVFGFNFFANAAAMQGAVFLAGNHILMQFVNMVATVLDAYANTAEAAVGSAYGAKDERRFARGVRLTSEMAAVSAVGLSLVLLLAGPTFIDLLTTQADARASAKAFLPFCAAVPVVGVAAYQLDGIFIGTTSTRAMRDTALVSLGAYLGLHYLLAPRLGAQGIWLAFLGYFAARGITLGLAFPRLKRDVSATSRSASV